MEVPNTNVLTISRKVPVLINNASHSTGEEERGEIFLGDSGQNYFNKKIFIGNVNN